MPDKKNIDLLLTNAVIYTCDTANSTATFLAVGKGNIVDVGSKVPKEYLSNAKKVIDMQGEPVFPGLYDPHCHFFHYAQGLSQVNLAGTGSVEEIIEKLKFFYDTEKPDWLVGRGWDQNDWPEQEFPDKAMLDNVFPDVPVYLTRIDGHAAWVNSKVIELAGITASTKVNGGRVLLAGKEPSGILIDHAQNLVEKLIPEIDKDQTVRLLQKAQQNCFAVGLTSVGDAGLNLEEVLLVDSLQQADILKMQVYAMLSSSEENINHFVKSGPCTTPSLTVRSIKLYADGALGSRGAFLLEPYNDDPENNGLLTISEEKLIEFCKLAKQNNYQVNTHCIGDAAVRKVLEIYSGFLEKNNDCRWRIEHAQVVNPNDLGRFAGYRVIPSIQATHATSDMYWAEERLGERTKHAYAYKQLLDQNGWLPNGSDFPVESINPLLGFYAAVARQDLSGFPKGGFQPENRLTREEALKAMTLWAARASFEEDTKGSLEAGKQADFVILDKDIMKIPMDEIPSVLVKKTFISGEKIFDRSE